MTTGRINQVVERKFLLLFRSFIHSERPVFYRGSLLSTLPRRREGGLFFHFFFTFLSHVEHPDAVPSILSRYFNFFAFEKYEGIFLLYLRDDNDDVVIYRSSTDWKKKHFSDRIPVLIFANYDQRVARDTTTRRASHWPFL